MRIKRTFQAFLLIATLAASLIAGGSAAALSACGTSYVVQSGDSLGAIASRCGTTVAALRLANPGMGVWIYAGQTLWLPGATLDGGNGTTIYIVARGDTLKSLAARFNTTMAVLANQNGIANYNLIYEGQRLIVAGAGIPPVTPPPSQPGPVSAGTYIVQWGDTMRKIASRLNVSLNDLLAVNPQIANPNRIFFGQVINVPASATDYTVQRGDTLRIIATRYGSTVDALLRLNPQIWNANWIYTGQVLRIR
jgi:LysM repeat protein